MSKLKNHQMQVEERAEAIIAKLKEDNVNIAKYLSDLNFTYDRTEQGEVRNYELIDDLDTFLNDYFGKYEDMEVVNEIFNQCYNIIAEEAMEEDIKAEEDYQEYMEAYYGRY